MIEAAGLGNAVSDVAGIGLAHHVESLCSRLISAPKLTTEQWAQPIVSWFSVISKSLCIFLGCIIGMSPLLFMNKHETKPAADDSENPNKQQQEKQTKSSN